MVHDFASEVNNCCMAQLVFNKMDLPGEHSVSVGGIWHSIQSIANKGRTDEHCLHVQHYLQEVYRDFGLCLH